MKRARPTPPPTPTPPPATPRPRVTRAPRVTLRAPAPQAAATPRRRSGGAAARKNAIHPRTQRERPAPPPSLALGTRAGQQNGGSGTGAGAGAGDSGRSGSSTGSGKAGSGNGSDANAGPCADIYLLPGPLGYRPDGTVVQQVLAKVIERDGTVEVQKFPYPFIYPKDADDPFRHDEAVSATNGGIPVQQPPPEADVSTMPPAVQTVLKYTDPNTGYTTLPPCTPDATP